jgi:hypothetical protein
VEHLVDRSESLLNTSAVFRKRTVDLKRSMWWKKFKLYIVICVIVVVCFSCCFFSVFDFLRLHQLVLVMVLMSVCGFTFQKCRKSSWSLSCTSSPRFAFAPQHITHWQKKKVYMTDSSPGCVVSQKDGSEEKPSSAALLGWCLCSTQAEEGESSQAKKK